MNLKFITVTVKFYKIQNNHYVIIKNEETLNISD